MAVIESLRRLWDGRHRGSEWTPLYMMVVVIIAAIVIISLVKPAFILASQKANEVNEDTLAAAKSALVWLAWPRVRRGH